MNRREFLATSLGGLTVTFVSGCALPVIPKRPAPSEADSLSWIRFENGRYTLFIPRVEMGQNISVALKQIACDELGVDWKQLELKLPSTNEIRRVRATVGSDSIKDFAIPLAQACATLRDALQNNMRTGVLTVQQRPIDALRAFSKAGRFVGKSMQLDAAEDIVRGRAIFVSDVRLENMLWGCVLRAPVSPEIASTVVSVNVERAMRIPGCIAIVQDPLLKQGMSEGIGIVAKTPGALKKIEAALDVRWDASSSYSQRDIDAAIRMDKRKPSKGFANKVLAQSIDQQGAWDIDLEINIPAAAHAPIEPRCAVARFSANDKMELWVGSQDVFYQRDVICKKMGLPEANVIVYQHRVGGAFGGKTIATVELEAAVLARAAKGAVRVQWTRAQEFQFGFHRPPSSHRIRARLQEGKISNWWHAFTSSHILFTNAVLPSWLQKLTDFIGDDGVARGSRHAYAISAQRIEFDLVRTPILTGPWRGLGAGSNNLAIEIAIDAIAAKANRDPIDFRLAHITDNRLQQTLRAVRDVARKEPLGISSSEFAYGRGAACGIYKGVSYAAVIADVEINRRTKSIRVRKMWCAHDCGRVINPDQVRAQCEGNMVWGIGMVLSERLAFEAGSIAATTFADYQIPRMSDTPMLETIVMQTDHPPTGAGETAIVASAGAIANAIYAATGKLVTEVPIDPRHY